ncbi:MAG TPA: SDR family oxidoreductase [Candidatus Binataceae bacterium]|nr:SDR family oxidoreductase [Candidatus Binataceae bacterium]
MTNNVEATAGTARAVMITGASTGIGRACALYLDRRGWRVFAGVRKQADADAIAKDATPQLTPVTFDVTDEPSIKRAAETISKVLDDRPLNGLVNNAGIALGGPVEFLSLSEFRRQLEVNLVGQLAVTQAFLPSIRRGPGRIVNISSIGGRSATPFLSPYNASKYALEALSDCMRAELKPWGIDVAIIEPGAIQSTIWDKARNLVTDITDALPPEGIRLYGNEIERMSKIIQTQEQIAVPAERVAKAVEHALTASRPRIRYIVGADAWAVAAMRWLLPDRIHDWAMDLVLRQMSARSAR